jgi:adenosylcobinamide-GDP ribazoletransferase
MSASTPIIERVSRPESLVQPPESPPPEHDRAGDGLPATSRVRPRLQRPASPDDQIADEAGSSSRSAVVSWLEAPFFALRFLTILPTFIARRPPDAGDFGRSDAFFPLVGLALGAILAGLDVVLRPVVSELVLNVLLVATLAGLTGALHLDGVIDTFDGLFAGSSREQRLAIMRDPRAGSYGVVAVVLLLACKLAALGSLPESSRAAALMVAPCLGRWGIVLTTYAFAYARPEGMGRSFKDSIRLQHLIVAGVIALGAAGLFGGIAGLVIWTIVGWLVLAAGRTITGALGGVTGDSYGAICELTEAGVLVAFGLHLWSVFG